MNINSVHVYCLSSIEQHGLFVDSSLMSPPTSKQSHFNAAMTISCPCVPETCLNIKYWPELPRGVPLGLFLPVPVIIVHKYRPVQYRYFDVG